MCGCGWTPWTGGSLARRCPWKTPDIANATRRRGTTAPALAVCMPPAAATAALGRVRIGTAGWVSPHWAGAFYPPGAKQSDAQLEHYQEHFDSVEVNSTHYGTPSTEALRGWRARAGVGFEFCWKADKAITHAGGSDGSKRPLSRGLGRTCSPQKAPCRPLSEFTRSQVDSTQ